MKPRPRAAAIGGSNATSMAGREGTARRSTRNSDGSASLMPRPGPVLVHVGRSRTIARRRSTAARATAPRPATMTRPAVMTSASICRTIPRTAEHVGSSVTLVRSARVGSAARSAAVTSVQRPLRSAAMARAAMAVVARMAVVAPASSLSPAVSQMPIWAGLPVRTRPARPWPTMPLRRPCLGTTRRGFPSTTARISPRPVAASANPAGRIAW